MVVRSITRRDTVLVLEIYFLDMNSDVQALFPFLKMELSSQRVIEANNAFHFIFFSFYLKSSVDNLLP